MVFESQLTITDDMIMNKMNKKVGVEKMMNKKVQVEKMMMR